MNTRDVRSWLGERVPIPFDQLRELTNEPVPDHMRRWWFALGGTPAYLFVVQIVTGILLAFYYEATPTRAFESVAYITREASFGWYFRSVHRWAATLMVAAMVLHQMRVFFTGAYRRPRELNWCIGMGLLLLTLFTAFTGYGLVYEQLSYWGATVGANVAAQLPLLGGFLEVMLLGGDGYNARTLSRFFVLHAAILPVLIALLVAIHIALVRLHGVSPLPGGERRGSFRFYPDHFYTELILGLVLMIVLSALATVLPATLGPRADALSTPELIKPEWFFYVAVRWLKLFSGTAAILSMGLIVSLMFVWPFIDGLIRRVRRDSELSVWIGAVAAAAIIALTIWEGAAAH